jgi:hypothetical protein
MLSNFKYNNYNKITSTLVGLIIGFALILMIPISDTAFAKPNFGSSTQGKQCSMLYDTIDGLSNKEKYLKSQGKTLSDSDRNALNQAIDEYMRDCRGYGMLQQNPKLDGGIIDNNDMVLEQPEQSSPPKSQLPEIALGDNNNNKELVNNQE